MGSLDEFAREEAILASLRSAGKVAVGELAKSFGVSTVTIRKDLEGLEERGLLRRVRGGAISESTSDEGAFEMRLRHSANKKRAIAKSVAPMIGNGDVIAIDASTTCFYLAEEILDRRNLVVITNGLRLASFLMERSSARILMPGGVVRRSSASLVGPFGDALTGRGRIAMGFFGVVGVSPTLGLLDIHTEEALTKRAMADACDRVYGLFDSAKVDGFGLHSFVDPPRISALFTDDGLSADIAGQWAEVEVPVHTTAVPSATSSVISLPTGGARR